MTEETMSASEAVDTDNGDSTQGFVDGVGDAPPIDAADLGIDLPEGPHDAVEMLLGELARARDEVEERTSDVKRVAAEFENYRKRVARDREDERARVIESVLRELLPVLDSYQAGLAHDAQTDTERRLVEGMRGTYNQLMDAMGRIGLEAIPADGEPFDPTVHEAVIAPPGVDRLVVIEELRRGYRFGGRVLRASMVALGEAGEENE